LTKEILDKSRIVRLAPIGGSMYPFIRSGEAIRIKSAKDSGVRYADIILYCDKEGKVMIHRIMGVRRTGGKFGFLVKGDSAARPDGVIRADEVIGKVVAIEKGRLVFNIDKGALRIFNVAYSLSLPLSRWIYALYYRCVKKIN
jgi:signal peptidase I